MATFFTRNFLLSISLISFSLTELTLPESYSHSNLPTLAFRWGSMYEGATSDMYLLISFSLKQKLSMAVLFRLILKKNLLTWQMIFLDIWLLLLLTKTLLATRSLGVDVQQFHYPTMSNCHFPLQIFIRNCLQFRFMVRIQLLCTISSTSDNNGSLSLLHWMNMYDLA